MYEFHYKCIKRKYDANLLFTGTNSLVYEIETKDVYQGFYGNKICLILVTINEIQ